MADITDRDSLRAWLYERPIEDSWAIAARAALRALPLCAPFVLEKPGERRAAILLPSFRANAVASVVGKWPTQQQGMRASASAAFSAALSAADSAAFSAAFSAADSAALSAAHSALSAAHSAAASAAADSAASAAVSADSAADSAAFWKAVQRDVEVLESGGSLFREHLWPDKAPMPTETGARWNQLRNHLLHQATDEGWEPWVNWYDGILAGDPGFEKLEVQKAQIPNEIWEAGPKAVNDEIARLTREFHDEPNVTGTKQPPSLDSLLAAKDLRAALSDFELDDLAHLMRMVRFVEDLRTLDDPALTKDRASRLSELADLMGDLSRDIKKFVSENAPGGYVSLAAGRYNREAKRPLDDVRPGRLWDLGLELAGSLKDVEVEGAFPDHLFQKLDHAVEKHREMMRDYFASVLTRMRPLDKIETADDAKPEDVVEALELAVDGLDEQDWGDTPAPDPEIPADMADRVDELKDILQRINQTTDETKRTGLLQTFWRKAKAASVTVLRYSAKVGRAVGWTASVGGGLATLFPSHFWKAVEMISKIFTSVPWPF